MRCFFVLLFAFALFVAPFPATAFDPESSPGTSSSTPNLQVPDTGVLSPEATPQLPPPMLPVLTEPADPSGFFFAAEQIRVQTKDGGMTPEEQRLTEFMYRLAFRFAKGPAALEAGRSLFSLLSTQGRLAEAASIAREWLDSFGPDWTMYRNLYDTLIAQGSFSDALALVSELFKAMPGTAKNRATELSWMEYNARSNMQDYLWAANGPPYIKTRAPDAYIAKIYRLYAAAPNVPQNQAALALFRAAATEKNYAEAIAHARPIFPTFTAPDAQRAWISELGKSFYGSGLFQEGIDFFMAALSFASNEPSTNGVPVIDRTRISTELSWVMAFYLARMYQGLGLNQTAASVFIELVPLAFSGEDSDSALWYWLDITMNSIAATDSALGDLGQDDANGIQAKRSLELSALSQAAALWKSPSFFEDIVANYMRRLLREGAWNDVIRLCVLMSQKLTASMKGPLLYLSGRLIETGRALADLSTESDFWKWLAPAQNAKSNQTADSALISAEHVAPLFFQALLRENGIEEHYRTLAAWRLGKEPSILDATPVLDKNFDIVAAIQSQLPQYELPPVSDENLKELLDFITQSLDYGLEALAANQVAVLSRFSTDSLLWLAGKFTEHEQYYPALRIGLEALSRKAAVKPELVYALLYPRAWPEHFASLATPRNIAEPLAYAIVRSESMFNQRAVSRSGAMGLSQLLPGTAAETARGLKMSQYALFDPKDNLTIGLTYYGYMLQRFDGRPARAIAAYNAGPSRMAQWVYDWGNLEDDILIELYPVAEPRQYTKNIIAAALHYGKMYYGISSKEMLDFMLAGKALPQPGSEQPVLAQPANVPPASGQSASTQSASGQSTITQPASAQPSPATSIPAASSEQGSTGSQSAPIPALPASDSSQTIVAPTP